MTALILPYLDERVAERFWRKVRVLGPDDCWDWLAATTRAYGTFGLCKGQVRPAHRVAYAIQHGREPSANVCHKCDYGRCQNGNHLFDGSQAVNIADAIAKRRMHWEHRYGERNNFAVLSEAQVAEILASDEGINKLAARLQVSAGTIRSIQRRDTWRHVAVPTATA